MQQGPGTSSAHSLLIYGALAQSTIQPGCNAGDSGDWFLADPSLVQTGLSAAR